MRKAVYSYQLSAGEFHNCYLELFADGLTTVVSTDKSDRVTHKVELSQLLADRAMTIEDIILRVKSGKMDECAIAIAMELLL